MLTYLKLKNFKSFVDVEIDFRQTQNKFKNFVAIYGENGSGKTNIISAYELLINSFDSLNFKEKYDIILEKRNEGRISNINNELLSFIYSYDMKKNYKNCHTIGQQEPTEIEYGFKINNKEGYYKIIFKEKLIYEKLYYIVNKKRGTVFEIKYSDNNIDIDINSIVKNDKYLKELKEEIHKYWGFDSFMAILFKELKDKNFSYIKKSCDVKIISLIFDLKNINVRSNKSICLTGNFIYSNKIMSNLIKGTLKNTQEKVLLNIEKALNSFFTSAYSDINNVFYKTVIEGDKIKYELYFKKLIGGNLIEINFNKESTGTKQLLNIFTPIVKAMSGETVLIDEINTGIHDLLMNNIIKSVLPEIKGQLIITTHNTHLLNSIYSLNKEYKNSAYVIVSDYKGNKEVNCINDYNFRIQKNNNLTDLYLKGAFGGIPFSSYIDFNDILDGIEDEENEKE